MSAERDAEGAAPERGRSRRGRGALLSREMQVRTRLRELRAELSAARSALGVVALAALAGCAVAALWLFGHLGFHLGVGPMLGVDGVASSGGALADGVRLLANAPGEVYRAGRADPLLLVVGFFALALPAAFLPLTELFGGRLSRRGLARPGGADPARQFGNAVAAAAMLVAALQVAWVLSSFRAARLTPLPAEAAAAAEWLAGRSAVSGLDVLAALAGVLWAILLHRVALAPWLRRLASVFAIGAAAIMLVSAAGSNAAATELARPRAAVRPLNEDAEALVLGEALGGTALLRRVGATSLVDIQPNRRLAVIGRSSIAAWLRGDAQRGSAPQQ